MKKTDRVKKVKMKKREEKGKGRKSSG